MKTLEHFLNQFHPIPAQDFQLLADCLQIRSFPKNTYLVQAGAVQQNLYFIESGVQYAYYDAIDKQHVIAFTYAPGLCALPESFLLQAPASCSLKCLTDSELYAISYHSLQTLFDQSPNLERLFRKMTEQVLVGIIQRHIELHALSMEERFRNFAHRSPHLFQLVPHKYIASYLGMDATNFSKLYNTIRL